MTQKQTAAFLIGNAEADQASPVRRGGLSHNIKTYFVALGVACAFASAAASAQAAPSTEPSSLPAAAQQGDIQFLSGGVGKDESDAIKQAAPHWPLELDFIGGTKDFVADVGVKLIDSKGATVLETSAQGPFMLIRVKPGVYSVQATYAQRAQTHKVTVRSSGHVRSRFTWSHQ